MRDLDAAVKRADADLSKADVTLKRKRDAVRRELKRKAEKAEGEAGVFDQTEGDGRVRLNPDFERSSSAMNGMGFERRSVATIEALRKDEQRIEGEFLGLVEKASRLVSRSERLRLRSEELIGERRQQQIAANAQTGGDTIFQGISDEMMDAAQLSNAAERNARLNTQ